MTKNITDELLNNKIGLIVLFCVLFTPFINFVTANMYSLDVNYNGPFIFTTIAYFIFSLFAYAISKVIKYKFIISAASISLLYLLLMIYEPLLQIGLKFISLKYITYATLLIILALSSITLVLFKFKLFIQSYIFFTIALFFVAIVGLFISYINQVDEKIISNNVVNKNTSIALHGVSKPEYLRNIYYIITDELGSEKGLISGDISTLEIKEFNKTLKDNGFYIADNSSSSYNSTPLSVQSIFEMDYPVVPDSEKYSNTANFFQSSLSIDKPKTLLQQTLLNSGYDKLYWSGNNGARCKDNASNLDCIRLNAKNLNEVIVSILQNNSIMVYLEQTIFPRVLHKITEGNYDAIDGAISHLLDDNIIEDNSLFFFIHQMMPHSPYVTENCEPIFGTGNVIVGPNNKDYYKSSISCLNKKIKKFIKFIDEKDKEAIVVVQGDHGSRFKENYNTNKFADISKEYFIERFSIFNAFRLPKDCNQYLYDSIGTVNSIRLVVACASGVEPKFIDDKNYYAAYKKEKDTYGKVIDVSDIVKR